MSVHPTPLKSISITSALHALAKVRLAAGSAPADIVADVRAYYRSITVSDEKSGDGFSVQAPSPGRNCTTEAAAQNGAVTMSIMALSWCRDIRPRFHNSKVTGRFHVSPRPTSFGEKRAFLPRRSGTASQGRRIVWLLLWRGS